MAAAGLHPESARLPRQAASSSLRSGIILEGYAAERKRHEDKKYRVLLEAPALAKPRLR